MSDWKSLLKSGCGFAIQNRSVVGWEEKILTVVASYHQIPFRLFKNPKDVPSGWVPSGSVEWVSKILGENVKPNYFPLFLSDWIKRKIWYEEKWPLRKVFIKPADRYKRFTGFITSGKYGGKKKGPFWCSEIVSFQDEWRYYIINGKVICGYWYYGIDPENEKPLPELTQINYPKNWCGTADFGSLPNGDIALVECHHPFSCGWYGNKNHDNYAEFIVRGWNWLISGEYKQFYLDKSHS
jgi:hypothetical protein